MRSGAADSSSPNADAADFLVYRLARWALNAPHGIAYVSYDSPAERTAVEARVLADVKAEDLTVERLDLSASTSIAEAIATLKAKIDATEADVLSVFGFGGFLRTLGEDWTPLNYRREEWFESGVRQIWWVPSVYDALFARRAPDLYSWFLIRESLRAAKQKTPSKENRPRLPEAELKLARQRSDAAQSHFRLAYSQKASLATLVGLIESAVKPLLGAEAAEEARQTFEMLLERLEDGKRRKEWASSETNPRFLKAKADLAALCSRYGQPLLAERLIGEVKTENVGLLSLADQGEFYLTRGRFSAYYGRLDQAERELSQALALFRKLIDPLNEAHALWSLGTIALETGDWPRARAQFEEALPLYESQRYTIGYANLLMRIGQIAGLTSDPQEALRLYGAARSSYETIGHRQSIAGADFAMGDIYLTLGRLELAQEAYERSLEIYRLSETELGGANAIYGLARIRYDRGELGPARDLFNEALHIYESVGEPLGRANALLSLGRCDESEGKLASSVECYGQAIQIFDELKQPLGRAEVLNLIGTLLIDTENADTARKYIEEAYALFNSLGNLLGRANTSYSLAKLEAQMENIDEARRWWKAALADYESLHNDEMIGRIHRALAHTGPVDDRQLHVKVARDAWTRAGRNDLILSLDNPNPI